MQYEKAIKLLKKMGYSDEQISQNTKDRLFLEEQDFIKAVICLSDKKALKNNHK